MKLRSSRIITLSLGSHTIGLAEFQTESPSGITLLNYGLREILIDPGSEETRRAQMSTALLEMMAELGIGHEAVNYAVPAHSVFTRFVKLPAIEDEKIERIIEFEAQQNVPFPIDEVVWDYQITDGAGEEQIQVVLVAIKIDVLDALNGVVEKTGLRSRFVDAAPMALCNAFRHNYGDSGGCSLLLDIGARTTTLLFLEPRKFFSRSIPIGGNSVTAAISREFGEPFEAADSRKKRDGFVRLGGANSEPSDPKVARVSRLMLNMMTRIHAEVVRSISHNREQRQGLAPDRVFLCGGTASAPCMREFFREELRLPVEYFDPLRKVAVAPSAPSVEMRHSAHLLGELVGLALRGVGQCPMSLNLCPPAVARRHQLERRRPFFIIAAAAIVLAALGWGFYYMCASQVCRAAAEKIKAINAPMHAAELRIERLRQEASKLDATSAPLVAAINDRSFWTQILEDLNARLPKEDIWITELVPLAGGKPVQLELKTLAENLPAPATPAQPANRRRIDGLLLRGLYLYNTKQQEVVVDYFKNLVGSPFFNVDPNNPARTMKSTIPNNIDWAFPYELRLELKKPLKIP